MRSFLRGHFLLVATYLQPVAKRIVKGSLVDLETSLYQEIISNLDVMPYENKKIIVKGCSRKTCSGRGLHSIDRKNPAAHPDFDVWGSL